MNKLDDASNSTLVPTDKLKEMQARLAAAEEALKFYAEMKHYRYNTPNGTEGLVIQDDGNAARAYFEKYRDKP